MALDIECSDGFLDERLMCNKHIEDPDDYEKFQALTTPKCNCEKPKGKISTKIESEKENFYILEVLVDRIKLIEQPVVYDEDEEFLMDDATKKKRAEAEEAKRQTKAKLLARIKIFDFPTMEIEQEEYKEPVVVKVQKVYKEWAPGAEEEGEEKNWMNELKEKMKQVEKEDQEKLMAANVKPSPEAIEKEFLIKRLEEQKVIGKSCFFSMVPLHLVNTLKRKKMDISLYQIGDVRTNTKTKYIGELSVPISTIFTTAVKRASCPIIRTPVIASVKEDYDIYSSRENRNTATISVYIRIVCMGYSAYPERKTIPMPAPKKVSEVETLVSNLKALDQDVLARSCPMMKEFRQPKEA